MALKGSFFPLGDKSISHRLALFSLIADGECKITNCSHGADVRSSLGAVKVLGSEVNENNGIIKIKGAQRKIRQKCEIDCGNSGTTMRLLMGILSGVDGEFVLDGDQSLRSRPMERIASPLRLMGAKIETNKGKAPVTVQGTKDLKGIEYTLPVPSAQLKSAILLAGVGANGETKLIEPILSRDHTERMFKSMGVGLIKIDNGWILKPSKLVFPSSFYVPGDPSSAAFFLCASAIIKGSDVTAEKILLNPTRIGFIEVLKRMNAKIDMFFEKEEHEPWGNVRACYSENLVACQVDEKEIPSMVDEIPILSLVATQAKGTSIFNGVEELRIKETDRLAAISGELGKMGANIIAEQNRLIIKGPTPLHEPTSPLNSFGDHRIAMTLRLASLFLKTRPAINEEDCLVISYPNFHETLDRLIH